MKRDEKLFYPQSCTILFRNMLHYWKHNTPFETKKYSDVIQDLPKKLSLYSKTSEDMRPPSGSLSPFDVNVWTVWDESQTGTYRCEVRWEPERKCYDKTLLYFYKLSNHTCKIISLYFGTVIITDNAVKDHNRSQLDNERLEICIRVEIFKRAQILTF